jgi:hypothetical protein
MPRTVKPKMAIPGSVKLQASESRSFSSVQWGLLAAAQFNLHQTMRRSPNHLRQHTTCYRMQNKFLVTSGKKLPRSI